MSEKEKEITKGLSELLIQDVFQKHGVEHKKRNLTPEQRQQIKSLVEDLQQQVDQFLEKSNQTPPKIVPTTNASNGQQAIANQSESVRQRRRLGLKRNGGTSSPND